MDPDPFKQLERVLHEPHRLAIVSSLCAAGDAGCLFADLKQSCELTDGNLNRHLNALATAGIVAIIKTRRPGRSRCLTRIHLTEPGREKFLEYLLTLEQVLKQAAESLEPRSAYPDLFSPWAETT